MGTWNNDEGKYDNINWANIQWGIENVNNIIEKWGAHPALYAIEPLNSPWSSTDPDVLKTFYRTIRTNMKAAVPDIKFVFHDSKHSDAYYWNDLFDDNDMENVIMETHYY